MSYHVFNEIPNLLWESLAHRIGSVRVGYYFCYPLIMSRKLARHTGRDERSPKT